MAYRESPCEMESRPRRRSGWMQAGAIDWVERRRLTRSTPPARRSTNGSPTPRVNTCWNAVDRHVLAGRGKQPAIIHDSPVTGTQQHVITYAESAGPASAPSPAGALKRQGRDQGRPRHHLHAHGPRGAGIAMLACGRIGAIHSVVFGGFAANELAVRIDDCTAKGHHRRLLRHRTFSRVVPLQTAARRRHRSWRRTSPTSA